MRVRVLMGFCLGRSGDVFPGDLVELDDHFARQRIREGRAEPAPEAEPIAAADNGSAANDTTAMSGVGQDAEPTGAATAVDPGPQRGARGRKPAGRSEA